MMFFHTEGNGQLRVNSNIWVYFVCSISLSLLIILRCSMLTSGSHYSIG